MPTTRYFIFGEGDRPKLLYCRGRLQNLRTGEVVWQDSVIQERILASRTRIELVTKSGLVVIREDEKGIWLNNRKIFFGASINRPDFEPSPHAGRLRALHHEILVNIVDGAPLPNLLVYPGAWRRDASMAAMVLARTGNLQLIDPWIRGLDAFFDGNAGINEPDNIGQTLFLLGAVGARDHPLIAAAPGVVESVRKGQSISGLTDGKVHSVYQTLWLIKGLQAIGKPAPFNPPLALDHYANLAWWSAMRPVPFPYGFSSRATAAFPYLSWAECHSFRLAPPALPGPDAFPQSWEARSAKADWSKLTGLGLGDWAKAGILGPHIWHAAEAFCYLQDMPHLKIETLTNG
jgi:hypothetical protein